LIAITWMVMVAAHENVIVGYFPEWSEIDVSTFDFGKLTHINYSFGKFDEQNLMPSVGNSALLGRVVDAAHKFNCKVLVSLGGGSGSAFFSPIMANPTIRSKFANNVHRFINDNRLDGIDIDWEYPGQPIAEGNKYDKEDSNNFILFLNELRDLIGNEKLITIAVGSTIYVGQTDLSKYGQVLDFINIMAYDMNYFTSPKSGPNGGLDYEEGKGAQSSVKSSVKAWNGAGIPNDKLVIGLPFYGIISQVKENLDASTGMYANRVEGTGDALTYADIKKKALSSSTEADISKGWTRYFDQITQTPWLFNKQSKTLICYDDIQSLVVKSQYVLNNGLRGVMIWSLNQDFNSELLNSVQIV
ncbi:glycoside hydrolase, partial [Neoconidiobolus thromboides FSU 785]